MPEPVYVRPDDLEGCLRALAGCRGTAAVLAGGTDLVLRMKAGRARPDLIVDLGAVAELRGVRRTRDLVRVGAMTSMAELASNEDLERAAPCLVEAARCMGSAQIRSMATLGGNLVNASPVADTVPPLMVLGAEAVVAGPSGERRLPVGSVATGPGRTALGRDEVLVALEFEPVRSGDRTFYLRVAQRKLLSIVKASVACRLRLARGVATQVAVAAGAVGPRVLEGARAAAALEGARLDDEVIRRAGEALAAEVTPIDDHRSTAAYRGAVCGRLLEKGLFGLLARRPR